MGRSESLVSGSGHDVRYRARRQKPFGDLGHVRFWRDFLRSQVGGPLSTMKFHCSSLLLQEAPGMWTSVETVIGDTLIKGRFRVVEGKLEL